MCSFDFSSLCADIQYLCVCVFRMLPCCSHSAAPKVQRFPPQAVSGLAWAASPHRLNTAAPSAAGLTGGDVVTKRERETARHILIDTVLAAMLSSNTGK